MESAALKGKNGLSFLLYTLLFWVMSPFLLLLLGSFPVYKFLVTCLQKMLHPDWIGMLVATDALMSEMSETAEENYKKRRSNFLSVSIHVMRGTPNLEKIRKGFLEKIYLHKNSKGQYSYEKLSYYMKNWLTFRFWKKDESFNVENHIKLIRLKVKNPEAECDENSSSSSSSGCYVKLPDDFPQESFKNLEKISEERLYRALGDERMTTDTSQMPAERSPWQLLILPNYQPKTRIGNSNSHFDFDSSREEKNEEESRFFVIILRFHHALFDGFSLKKMITENFAGEKMTIPIENQTSDPEKANSKNSRFSYFTLQGLLHLPMKILGFNWVDKDENDWKIPLDKLSQNWHSVVVDPIPFSVVRSVGKKIGVSPNTLVFGALDGAIQRMWKLQNKYEKLPKTMRAPFPWSMECHPMEGLVNHWSFGEFQLPLKTVQNQKERFLILEEQFQWQKKSKLPELFWHCAQTFFSSVPHSLMDVVLVSGTSTVTVSNFPGPRNQLTFLDEWPLEDWTFCVPKLISHSAFQFAIMSYRGWIRIVLTVNTAVMPSYEEVEQFGQCIKEEFLDLENMIK